jgi:hypothetical protein
MCLPPVSRHLLTCRTVFSKTVFSIVRSTFRMYFVMAIFNSSIVWGLFVYTEFFIAPQRKNSGAERSGDLGGQMVLEMILSANTSSKSAIDMRCMSRSAILLKAGLVNFIFFQLLNEGIHSSVTVPFGVERLREKNGSDYAPTRHSNPNTIMRAFCTVIVRCTETF